MICESSNSSSSSYGSGSESIITTNKSDDIAKTNDISPNMNQKKKQMSEGATTNKLVKTKKRLPVINIDPSPQLRQKTTNSSRGKVLEENPDEFLHKFLFDVTDLDDSESNLFYLPQLSSEDNTNVHERANDTEQVLREEF